MFNMPFDTTLSRSEAREFWGSWALGVSDSRALGRWDFRDLGLSDSVVCFPQTMHYKPPKFILMCVPLFCHVIVRVFYSCLYLYLSV